MGDDIKSGFRQLLNSITPMHVIASAIGLFAIVGIVFIVARGAEDGAARGFITISVAIVTIAIALILLLYLIVGTSDDLKERFTLGKDILMVFVGILGTIMGFYYASNNKVSPSDISAIASSVQSSAVPGIVELEKKGFEALIAKDFDGASKAFTES